MKKKSRLVKIIECPKCGSYKITNCKGGTAYLKLNKDIHYICTDCLYEF